MAVAGYGGKISSEWFFPKALQILHEDPGVYARAGRLIEAADWIVWQLTGVETRNTTTAGYKAIWSNVDGFPSRDYFAASTRASRTSWTRRCRAGSTPSAGAQAASASALQPGRDCCPTRRWRSRTSTRTCPRQPSAAWRRVSWW